MTEPLLVARAGFEPEVSTRTAWESPSLDLNPSSRAEGSGSAASGSKVRPSGYEPDEAIRLDVVSFVPVMVGTTSSAPRIAFIRFDVDQSVSVRLTQV
jgi:hypothetical protein